MQVSRNRANMFKKKKKKNVCKEEVACWRNRSSDEDNPHRLLSVTLFLFFLIFYFSQSQVNEKTLTRNIKSNTVILVTRVDTLAPDNVPNCRRLEPPLAGKSDDVKADVK